MNSTHCMCLSWMNIGHGSVEEKLLAQPVYFFLIILYSEYKSSTHFSLDNFSLKVITSIRLITLKLYISAQFLPFLCELRLLCIMHLYVIAVGKFRGTPRSMELVQ